MSDYRTPLPSILAGMLEVAINRILALDEATPERLQQLENRLLQLDLEGIGISLFFSFTSDRVEVSIDSENDPDTTISGSPVALFAMAVPEGAGNWSSPDSRVTITGDANLARDLERLFSRLDPDWEATLSRVFGDVLGHQVASGLRAGADQAREAAGNAGEMVSEFLQRSEGPLVKAADIRTFADDVDETRDAVERLEARIQLMQEAESPEDEAPEDET